MQLRGLRLGAVRVACDAGCGDSLAIAMTNFTIVIEVIVMIFCKLSERCRLDVDLVSLKDVKEHYRAPWCVFVDGRGVYKVIHYCR